MKPVTPEAFLEELIDREHNTFEADVARLILPVVRECGISGFEEFIMLKRQELDAAEGLWNEFFRDLD